MFAQAVEAAGHTGEAVVFWSTAPIAVLSALGLVVARKAVHGAMFVAVTMICLAILYFSLEAPFLGVVQIVVYTGAIMMLFLFVIMLIGVDVSDSRVETIRGQRVAAVLAGIGFGLLLVAVAANALVSEAAGMAAAQPEGNVAAIADRIFSRHVWVFEVTSALLITAALGAMVLTYRERLFRRPSQRELAVARFRRGGTAASPLPSPGVYARHNAVDTPALLPDGTPSELSISPVLVARGTVRPAEQEAAQIEQLEQQVVELTGEPLDESTRERP
ncbi:MAG: NADH-quinone oxidoreductase subunit J [Jiangellaceae bacterium]|nr:NADH-quinone oxidoreductase subunit J [Jiangellaceae bacterium]